MNEKCCSTSKFSLIGAYSRDFTVWLVTVVDVAVVRGAVESGIQHDRRIAEQALASQVAKLERGAARANRVCAGHGAVVYALCCRWRVGLLFVALIAEDKRVRLQCRSFVIIKVRRSTQHSSKLKHSDRFLVAKPVFADLTSHEIFPYTVSFIGD